MKYRRSHAINILEHTSRFLILLLFPVIRALLLTDTDFYTWLKGAYFDIIVILLIFGFGIWAWLRYGYCLGENGIYIRKGIIVVKRRYIPYSKLSVLSIEKTFYLIPVRAVRVRADTDGGYPTTPDFEITINRRELEEFQARLTAPFMNYGEIKRVYLPKNFYIAILSFIVSNTLTGVLFVSTLISGTGNVLGREFENLVMGRLTKLAESLAFGAPPVAAIIALAILGGWVVSFVLNLIRHLGFSATRQSGTLFVKSGLVTKREYSITIKRINLIELRQTLLTKLFGFYSAFIHCNGYGKKQDELSLLMPACDKMELRQNIQLLLPEIPLCPPTLRPTLRVLSRFLIPPIAWILSITAAWILAYELLPMSNIILFIGIMAEIPCFWYLFVKIVSFFHTGVGESSDVYTFSYTYGYRIKTIAVPKRRIVKLTIRRSLFQVMSGCCDLVILTYSEGRKRHVVPNIGFEEAKRMMNAQKL